MQSVEFVYFIQQKLPILKIKLNKKLWKYLQFYCSIYGYNLQSKASLYKVRCLRFQVRIDYLDLFNFRFKRRSR